MPHRLLSLKSFKAMVQQKKEILPGVEYCSNKRLNNKTENSHQPTRQKEKSMRQFKTPQQIQRFLSIHGQLKNLFGAHRYKITANQQREHLVSS